MGQITKGKEITVKLGNTTGSGATLFGKLKDAEINVRASCCYLIDDEALFSIVPEAPDEAMKVLEEAGLSPHLQDVLLVDLPNEPGALATLLQQISALGVNVTSAYVTTSTRHALAVVKTSDDARVVQELRDES